MKGKKIFISFQGAESGLALWLNGNFVGYSEDSFTPSEFELTPYLKEGENKLAAQVFKWTSGSWCEDQDFFRFSGIYRDVYLYAIPEVHVEDLTIRTLLDDTFTKADLTVELKATAAGKVRFTLSREGKEEATLEDALESGKAYVMKMENPLLWSAEEPQSLRPAYRGYGYRRKDHGSDSSESWLPPFRDEGFHYDSEWKTNCLQGREPS